MTTTDKNVETVKILDVTEDVDISIVLCHAIFSDGLSMKRVINFFRNFDQKNHTMSIAQEVLNDVYNDSRGL